MDAEGIVLGIGFLILVVTVAYLFIPDIQRKLRVLAIGLFILGASMLILGLIGSYYFNLFYIEDIGRALYYILMHLGIMTIIYGKIFQLFEDIKYQDSKWKPINNMPLYTYIAVYIIIQILGYGLNIDGLKVAVITENTTTTTLLGIPLLLSLMVASIMYYFSLRQKKPIT